MDQTLQLRISHFPHPVNAKQFGRRIPLRLDWEQNKLRIMEELLRQKFANNPPLMRKLLATGEAVLIEGNHWHDIYWGTYKGIGDNHLGKLLMRIRIGARAGAFKELAEEEAKQE